MKSTMKETSNINVEKKDNISHKSSGAMLASMFKIGLIGFGGGSALIPVIEKEVVKEEEIVSQEEYDKDVIVACITPGALPVEIAAGLGKRTGRVRDMLLASNLMALPGVLMTIVLLSVLSSLNKSLLTQIECLSIGITAFISCLLTEYARSTIHEARAESKGRMRRAFFIMLGVFVLCCGGNIHKILGIETSPIFNLSTIQVLGIAFFGILYTHCKFTKKNLIVSALLIIPYILCAGGISVIDNIYIKNILVVSMFILSVRGLYLSIVGDKKHKNKHTKTPLKPLFREMTAWLLFMVFFSIPAVIVTDKSLIYIIRGFISSILSFGGGDAYLSVADGMFVSTGMITEGDFYSRLVSVANVLPGSILCKTLAGVGYYIGYNLKGNIWQGFAVSMSGFVCSVAASGLVFCLVYYIYESFQQLVVFKKISRWIRPIIAGLLLNIMISMIYQNMKTGSLLGSHLVIIFGITIFIYMIDMFLIVKKKMNNGFLIIVSGVLGIFFCNCSLIAGI